MAHVEADTVGESPCRCTRWVPSYGSLMVTVADAASLGSSAGELKMKIQVERTERVFAMHLNGSAIAISERQE